MNEYHTTKEGLSLKISEMDDKHLVNTINMIKRMARRGLVLRDGGGDSAEDFWYDEFFLFGEEALEYLNYYAYTEEVKKRNIGWTKEI